MRRMLFTACWALCCGIWMLPAALAEQGDLLSRRIRTALRELEAFGIESPGSLDAANLARIRNSFRKLESRLISAQSLATPAGESAAQIGRKTEFRLENDLLLTALQRFLSGFSASFEVARASDLVLSETDPDSGTEVADNLRKFTLAFDLGRLFLTSSDLSRAYGRLQGIQSIFGQPPADPLPGLNTRQEFFQYFSRSRKRDFLYRTLGAFDLSVASSDQFADISNLFTAISNQNNKTESVSVRFSPDALFSSSNRLHALAAYAAYATAFPERLAQAGEGSWLPPGEQSCTEFRDCVRKSRNRGATVLRALLPDFEFRTSDQFDFVQAGGRPTQRGDDKVESFIFSWNLSRLFERLQARSDLIDIVRRQREIEALRAEWDNGSPVIAPVRMPGSAENEVLLAPNSLSRLVLKTTQPYSRLSWCLVDSGQADGCPKSPAKCRGLPPGTAISEMSFAGGVLEGTATEQPGLQAVFQATDRFGRCGTSTVRFLVRPARLEELVAALLRDYIDIALDQSILLDEAWFAEFRARWQRLHSLSGGSKE